MTLDRRITEMIRDAAIRLDGSGRVCLTTWERQGQIAMVDLGVGAGREMSSWVRGFDPAWGRFSPGIVNLAALAEHTASTGYSVLDLGPGEESYKARFADGWRGVERTLLFGRNLRPFHTPAQLLPLEQRDLLVERVQGWRARVTRRGGGVNGDGGPLLPPR